MADEKRPAPSAPPETKPAFDPFKADDPVIPGVPSRTAAKPAAPRKFAFDFKDPKVMAGASIGLVIFVLLAWMVFGPSDEPQPVAATNASAQTAPAGGTVPATGGPEAPASPVVLTIVNIPGEVGTIEEFPTAWSVKKILLQRTGGRVPALIIRLPGASPRRAEAYWGLLLLSPYGRCELEYETDLKKISDDYGYRARHPMVVDPCNLTVFDPARLGDIGGVIARGAVAQGTALRPPLAIELRIEGNRILAMQTE